MRGRKFTWPREQHSVLSLAETFRLVGGEPPGMVRPFVDGEVLEEVWRGPDQDVVRVHHHQVLQTDALPLRAAAAVRLAAAFACDANKLLLQHNYNFTAQLYYNIEPHVGKPKSA